MHKLKGYGVTLQPATLLLMNSAATTALGWPIFFGLQNTKQNKYITQGFNTEFNKALKISWILKYISNDCKSKWKCFFDFNLSKVGGKLVFLGNLAPKDARKLDIKDDFIQELTELWADFNYRDSFASQANFSAGHME